jgi:ABC-type branched-subunit amino acid transport system permease subunit
MAWSLRFRIGFGVGLAVLLVFPWVVRNPYYHLLGFNLFLLVVMASAWNMLSGYTGYKSLGHSVFFGIGAYAVAIMASRFGWNPLWSAPLLALVVAVVALGIGWVLLRAGGSAFVIATIAVLLIFRLLALNLSDLTNGAPGLSQPLPPWSPAFSRMPFYYYMLGVALVTVAASAFIRKTRFGLGLFAIRDDEGKAASVGVATSLYKVLAFGISAYFIAVAGGIWSYFQGHISPIFTFDILRDVDMVIASMLGGLGTLWGPVIGAFIIVPARDLILFRFGESQIHLAVFGVVMILILTFMPEGLVPSFVRRRRARRGKESAYVGAKTAAEMEGAVSGSETDHGGGG